MAGIINTENYENMMNALIAFAQRTEAAGESLINYCASAGTVLPSNDAVIDKIISGARASAIKYKQVATGALRIAAEINQDLEKMQQEDAIWSKD